MSRRCPVCWRWVHPTRGKNVAGHFDKYRRPCPFSGQPYELAYEVFEETAS